MDKEWKLVPVEPTDEMLSAGCKALGALYGHHGASLAYKAMLASAPTPPSSGLEPVAVINVNGANSCTAVLTRTWSLPVGSFTMVRLSEAEAIIAAKDAEIARLNGECNRLARAASKNYRDNGLPINEEFYKQAETIEKQAERIKELEAEAKRWRWYAPRGASHVGVSLEEFERVTDAAMKGEPT